MGTRHVHLQQGDQYWRDGILFEILAFGYVWKKDEKWVALRIFENMQTRFMPLDQFNEMGFTPHPPAGGDS